VSAGARANLDDPRISGGLAAQADARRTLLETGARRLGWKAGLGTSAVMERLGTRAPVFGFLTDATVVPNGGDIDVSAWANPTLEAEVALRLGRDLPAGASHEEAVAAVDAVAPALELVDLGALDDLEAVLAGNIFHRAVVLGTFAPTPGGAGLEAVRLEVEPGDGTRTANVDPTALLGHLADVVRALADQLPGAGDAMRAGDVVITGAAVPASALVAGTEPRVALAGGHSVTVRVR
jgi:2-keto-4-pentenoate hydratase